MPKYRIVYRASRKGALNPFWSELVDSVVEAENLEKARLAPYETHQHIHPPFGGFIKSERVSDDTPLKREVYERPTYHRPEG